MSHLPHPVTALLLLELRRAELLLESERDRLAARAALHDSAHGLRWRSGLATATRGIAQAIGAVAVASRRAALPPAAKLAVPIAPR